MLQSYREAKRAATAARATAEPPSLWMVEDAPLLTGLRPALAAPTGIAAPVSEGVAAPAAASGVSKSGATVNLIVMVRKCLAQLK